MCPSRASQTVGRDPFRGRGVCKMGSWDIPNMKKKNIANLNIIETINEIWQSDDDNLILIHNGAYEDLSLYLGRKKLRCSQ